MANFKLAAGDETKQRLLAGFGADQDGGDGSGARGGVGILAANLIEAIGRVGAAALIASSSSGRPKNVEPPPDTNLL